MADGRWQIANSRRDAKPDLQTSESNMATNSGSHPDPPASSEADRGSAAASHPRGVSPAPQVTPSSPADEPQVGRALRWSLALWVVFALLACGIDWCVKRTPGQTTPSPASALAEIPQVKFTDITAACGVTFSHQNGAYGDKLLPETMGGGVDSPAHGFGKEFVTVSA